MSDTTSNVPLFSLQGIVGLVMTRLRSMPFYLVAVLMHLLLLLAFATCRVVSNAPIIITEFIAPNSVKEQPKDAPPPPPPPPKEQKMVRYNTAAVVIKPTMISVALPNQLLTVPHEVVPPVRQIAATEPSKVKGHVISAIYGNRLNGAARAVAIAKGGGNVEKGETAVMKTLRWLRENQNEDGSWGADYKPSMTGLALLTYLAHGETQVSPEFGPTVFKGVQFLLDLGKKNQNKLSNGPFLAYQHAIATYALAEDYALTQNSELLTVLQETVAIIIKGQTTTGSWNYSYDPNGRNDTSVAGWNIQALKAAKNANIHVEGLDAAMKKATSGLCEMYDPKSDRFGYQNRGGGSDALEGVGILCLQFLGEGNSKEVRQALRVARTFSCSWEKATGPHSSYTWYYVTQAMFQSGGANWVAWNREFREEIIKHQKPDGHWPVPGTNGDDPPGKAQPANPKDSTVYHTTLICMMLEVYYRFLPTFKTG